MLQFNTSRFRQPRLRQTPEYGFVFIRNGAERLLIMFNPRDPNCTAAQSFNPFRLRDTYRQKSL